MQSAHSALSCWVAAWVLVWATVRLIGRTQWGQQIRWCRGGDGSGGSAAHLHESPRGPSNLSNHHTHAKHTLDLTLAALTYTTTLGCDRIFQIGQRHAARWQAWFVSGPACALGGFVLVVSLLSYNLFATLTTILALSIAPVAEPEVIDFTVHPSLAHDSAHAPIAASAIQVAIPGITVPWAKCGFLMMALCVSMAWHELGHALAAASCRVRSVRIGVMLACIFPAAYVELQDEEAATPDPEMATLVLDHDHVASVPFPSLTPMQKLNITSAGIWHNIVLCAACLLVLALLPIFISPFYASTQGLVVTDVDGSVSPALAEALLPATRILFVDGAPMNRPADFHRLLLADARNRQVNQLDGQCIDAKLVGRAALQTSAAEAARSLEMAERGIASGSELPHAQLDGLCCFPGLESRAHTSCFQFQDMESPAPAPVCLHAKSALQHSFSSCDSRSPNTCADVAGEPQSCVAMRTNRDAGERLWLLRISDRSRTECTADLPLTAPSCTTVVPFVGSAAELVSAVYVDAVIPRAFWSDLLPTAMLSLFLGLPHLLDQCLRWIFSVSASLAVLNCAPMYGTDGAHLVHQCADLYHAACQAGTITPLHFLASRAQSGRAVRLVLGAGSCLFLANVLISLGNLLHHATGGTT